MKRFLLAAPVTVMLMSGAALGTVYTRAWCDNPAHGRRPNGKYAWISETFVGETSDDCWKFAVAHRQTGHWTGCTYVGADGEERY